MIIYLLIFEKGKNAKKKLLGTSTELLSGEDSPPDQGLGTGKKDHTGVSVTKNLLDNIY